MWDVDADALPVTLWTAQLSPTLALTDTKGMIEWCRQQITSRDPRFQFKCFELKSVYSVLDNEQGTIDVESFRFPWADESFDSVFLASVFTHMPPGEVRVYLGEIARLLRPKGKALASIFFAPGELETRGRGTNVFHNAERFLADLASLPFDALLVSPEPRHVLSVASTIGIY